MYSYEPILIPQVKPYMHLKKQAKDTGLNYGSFHSRSIGRENDLLRAFPDGLDRFAEKTLG